MPHKVDPVPVNIAIIGGGSLNWAISLMADLAYDKRLIAQVRLYDIDHKAAERNAAIGARYAEVSRGQPAHYKACSILAEALKDADVVIISILPGSFEDMAQDIGIPQSYGIPQSVGDTVGPGGFMRALRAIPMMVEIAEAIRDTAPDAFVCNLSNPMSALTGALYATFPNIKAWGECHEVTKIRKQVAWIANQNSGATHFTHRDVDVTVLGINHFTFVNEISLSGMDMLPAYLAFVAANSREGWPQTDTEQDEEHARYFGTRNLVAFDLLRRFGIPAAAGDRHLAEFFPAEDYLSTPARWGFALTPVEYRIRDRQAKLQAATEILNGKRAPKAQRSDEAIIDQIFALMSGMPYISNVNLPNRGQMPDLPKGAIVETNAVFSKHGVTPIYAGTMPSDLRVLVSDHAERQTELVKAARTAERNRLLELFSSDPLVAPLSKDTATMMFEEMRAATEPCLPNYLKEIA